MRLRNIASRYGDIYAYCKQYPFYKKVEICWRTLQQLSDRKFICQS